MVVGLSTKVVAALYEDLFLVGRGSRGIIEGC